MNYNVHAWSADMRRSMYSFAGDTAVDESAYEQAVFAGYVSTVSTLYGVANGVGVKIDFETFERWKRITSATGHIDDFLDEADNPGAAHAVYSACLEAVVVGDSLATTVTNESQWRNSLVLLQNSVQTLPAERKHILVNTARSIGSAAIEKAECDDVARYVDILRKEGGLAAMLATESVSSYVRDQPNYAKFSRWCVSAIEAATLLDHARDLRRDYEGGITQVDPTARHALHIARAAMSPLSEILTTQEMVRATSKGLRSRMQFSVLPTKLTMKLAAGVGHTR